MTTRVWFVGAGPGDPTMLTLRGAEAIARADVVLHDAAVHEGVLARAREGAARIEAAARDASEAIVARAREGKTVARVVAGDPLLFDPRGEAEIAAVARAGIAFEIVPGVPHVAAAAACAGVAIGPNDVVARGDGDAITEAARAWLRPASTPAIVVAAVGTARQRVIETTLDGVPRAAHAFSDEPLLLVVGDAARADRRAALGWFDRRPLFGKRVLVTRTREQASTTAALLRERGAEPIALPTIELHPPRDPSALERAIAHLGDYAWVAFTSANGVERAWAEVARQRKDARAFGKGRVAAIGPGTAQALEAHGLSADVVAKEFKGEGLALEMLTAMRPGDRVLLLRAQVARDALPDALRAAGHEVDVVAAYETRPPDASVAEAIARALDAGEIDAVTFTSSSTVDNLCDLLGDRAAALLAKPLLASIGPITTATLEKRGLRAGVTAREYTVPGLVAALEQAFAAADGG